MFVKKLQQINSSVININKDQNEATKAQLHKCYYQLTNLQQNTAIEIQNQSNRMTNRNNKNKAHHKMIVPHQLQPICVKDNHLDEISNVFKNYTIMCKLPKIISSNNSQSNRIETKKTSKIMHTKWKSKINETLHPSNRYFDHKPLLMNASLIDNLGLYESANRFKFKNVQQFNDNLKPNISPKLIVPMHSCNKDELIINCEQIKHESQEQFKRISYNQDVNRNDYSLEQIDKDDSDGDEVIIDDKQQCNVHYTLKFYNYELVMNDEYYIYKSKIISHWADFITLINEISNVLKCKRISSIIIRTDQIETYWIGKKIKKSTIMQMLKIQSICTKNENIHRIIQVWKDKTKISILKKQKERKIMLIKWVYCRFKYLIEIKKQRQRIIKKANELHEQLKINNCWQVEIHLSSFSQNQFLRTTTQYMTSFENKFINLWKIEQNNNKIIIIILTRINQFILEILKNKFKIKNKIILICLEKNIIYSQNLSLAAKLLFSYKTLNRIKKIIHDKKTIIIPGKFNDQINNNYQFILSVFLNAALFTTLNCCKQIQQQKSFFQQCNITINKYIIISAKCCYEEMIHNFVTVIINNPKVKQWLIKINGQFNGRGLATLKISRLHRQAIKNNIQGMHTYMKQYLRFQLKINFENSLYMIDGYLNKLMQQGGVIEEYIQFVKSYQLCFLIINSINLINCYQTYHSLYSTKAYLMIQPNSVQLCQVIQKIKLKLKMHKYYGYVSVNVSVDHNHAIVGIDIKAYQTQSSAASSLIRQIKSKKQATLRNSDVRDSTEINEDLLLKEQHYLYISNILLTDISDESRQKILEEIMNECWKNTNINSLLDYKLYFSLGQSIDIIIITKDKKKIKKIAIQAIKELYDKINNVKQYCGKNRIRDVFQFGQLIRAISKINLN